MGLDHQPEAVAIGDRGAHGHQQVHIARPGPQGLVARHIEAPAQNELHRRRQRPLQPEGQHDPEHGQGERQGEREGHDHPPALVNHARFIRSGDLGVAGGVAGEDFGLIARVFHGGHEIGGSQQAVLGLHRRLFGCEIDQRGDDAGNRRQRRFNAADATGAGHAADLEVEGLVGNAIARGLDGAGQGRRGGLGGVKTDLGPFGGEVHLRGDAGQGAKRTLDPPSAGGAGHALHGDGEIPG